MRSLAAAFTIACALPLAAHAAEPLRNAQTIERAQAFSAKAAARFSFLTPGKTTEHDLIARLGEPEVDYDTYLEEGDIDPRVAPPFPGSIARIATVAHSRDHEMVPVHVLEYDLGGDDDLDARVVLEDGVVLYAILPVSPMESTVAKLEDLFGKGETRSDERAVGDRMLVTPMIEWPARGVAFVLDEDVATRKIIRAAAKN